MENAIKNSMNKIVLATDFSDNATHAAARAAGIAEKCGATLYILHGMDGATDPVFEPVALDTVLLEKYTREEFGRLQTVKQHIAKKNPFLTVELRLSRGMAADAILSLSEKEKADLIVMGAHGSGHLKELAMGSVTAGLIDRSKTPVLAVPPEYEFREPRTILLAVKDFLENRAPLNPLINIAGSFGGTIDIISFVNPHNATTADQLDAVRHLDHYTQFLQHNFPSVKFSGNVLTGDDLQESIDQYCRRHNIEMLAVFNHPRSFFDNLCRRNHTRRAVFHSHVPVLVLQGP